MRLRQEQVVFLATLGLVCLLGWSLVGSSPTRRGRRSGGEAPQWVVPSVPEVASALPAPDVAPPLLRGLFERPSDTRALPPLAFDEPPALERSWLLPPPAPGPAAPAWGRLLRRPYLVEEGEVQLLRDALDADGLAVEPTDSLGSGAAPIETPAAREARLAAWRGRYDWLQRGPRDVRWGRIVNEDRLGLVTDPSRDQEPIEFVEVDPETGREVHASVGAPAISYGRERFETFGFAETPANELALRRRRLLAELSRSDYDDVLALAEDAIRLRLEVPDALALAEEAFAACAAFDPADPAPRLGLARCHEASFDLDRAWNEYSSVERDFPQELEARIGLARIERRLLLVEAAEARLRTALEAVAPLGAAGEPWRVRWALGVLLLEEGRPQEALEHLREANRSAPNEPELLFVRVGIRTDHGAAALAVGETEEAARAFGQALAADAGHQRALAGAVALRTLDPQAARELERFDAEAASSGFELALSEGVAAIERGDFEEAHERLRAAELADPLRSAQALRALAFLAERTGSPDESLRLVQDALERDPTDAWAAFQQGRLLAASGDFEGARAAFRRALELEVDFVDALVELAHAAFQERDFEDVERILGRALELEEERAEVHELRGRNRLRLGLAAEARRSFERAGELAAGSGADGEAGARAGIAWCTYLDGDSTEATILLANLDDARRDRGDEDPWRLWARRQIERIREHEGKVEWTDDFDDWSVRESVGPLVSLVDGEVRIEGVFQSSGSTQLFREYAAGEFVSIEANVSVGADTNARVGLFVARERRRRDRNEVMGEISVSRHKEGGLQVRFVRSGNEPEILDMQQPFPTDRPVRLRIERAAGTGDPRVTLSLDGVALIEGVPMPSLGRAASPVAVGAFAEGETGRSVRCGVDDVAIVHAR